MQLIKSKDPLLQSNFELQAMSNSFHWVASTLCRRGYTFSESQLGLVGWNRSENASTRNFGVGIGLTPWAACTSQLLPGSVRQGFSNNLDMSLAATNMTCDGDGDGEG